MRVRIWMSYRNWLDIGKWYDSDLRQTGEAAKLSAVELVRIPIGHLPTFLREAVTEHDPQGLAMVD
jgi:hypothetical protein